LDTNGTFDDRPTLSPGRRQGERRLDDMDTTTSQFEKTWGRLNAMAASGARAALPPAQGLPRQVRNPNDHAPKVASMQPEYWIYSIRDAGPLWSLTMLKKWTQLAMRFAVPAIILGGLLGGPLVILILQHMGQ
jgi:hypothetical protein